MKNTLKILAAVFVLAGAQSALAAPLEFTADLSGPNESPPNASPGTGFADVFYDPDLHTLQVHVSFTGLLGTTTASHIHCCTAVPLVSTSGIATVTPNFTGFPLGVTSGTYDSQVFDLTSGGFNNAFITANGGTTASAEAALLAGLMGERAYLNIHTNVVPGGEIRGFLAFVPEPITLSLFGAGLVGAAAMRGRKKKVA